MCLAIPGKLMEMDAEASLLRMGKVSFGGIVKSVNLAYVPEVKIGDYVVVHVGFAISIVDEVEAKKVFEYLEEMNEIEWMQVEGELA